MNTATLDLVRAAAIERELSAIGTNASRLQRRQRRTRGLSLTLGSVALVAALTGAAIVVNNLPGTTTVAPLGEIVFSGSFTGTANVELGNPPADADVVILDVTCTKGGRMEVPVKGEGASIWWDCDNPIRKDTVHIRDGRLPAAGATYITITADQDTEWSVTAEYGSSDATPWGVNANGQSYGVPNEYGVPDLVATLATNGVQGYTLNEEMTAFEGEGFINVYKSDGTTVIGQFRIGDQE
jgi:hypothetical protein